jgi:peptidoglycan/xylan/chitin deacetylase (PgdA/CDA1 family)
MYHRLTAGSDPHPYSLAADRFRAQLALLRALGYRSVSPGEIARAVRSGAPLPRRAVSITFDDGYRDTLTVALPILRQFGFTAVCYVVQDRVGGISDWTTPAPLMNWSEVEEWLRAGMDIGSHSRTHRDLTSLGAAELRHEVESSRALLEDRLGRPMSSFAYPFNRFGPRELDTVAAAGYECACAGPEIYDSMFALTRVRADGDSLTWFLARLLPMYPELRHLYRGVTGGSAHDDRAGDSRTARSAWLDPLEGPEAPGRRRPTTIGGR